MSGLELLRHIRQEFETSPPEVIMITAYGDTENYNQALNLGASDLLTKPLNFNLLREKLQLESYSIEFLHNTFNVLTFLIHFLVVN